MEPEPDWVETPGGGSIGMTSVPRHLLTLPRHEYWESKFWHRMRNIRDHGGVAVVALMTAEELSTIGTETLEAETVCHGLEWHCLPVDDEGIPQQDFETPWVYAGLRLRTFVRAGQRIVLWCLDGPNRTGVVAARLLVELGNKPKEAIRTVKEARPTAISTEIGESHVLALREFPGNDDFLDRLLGCLLGGALGDAYGRTRGGARTARAAWRSTQSMSAITVATLRTLEGLFSAMKPDGSFDDGRLVEEIGHPLRLRTAHDRNGSAAVTSAAPLAFLRTIDLASVPVHLGSDAGDSSADEWSPARFLVETIRSLVEGRSLPAAIEGALDSATRLNGPSADSVGDRLIRAAQILAAKLEFAPNVAVRCLGEGQGREQALAVGAYAALAGNRFEHVMALATNHDGPRRAAAALAGQLWGAWRGCCALPNERIQRLAALPWIADLARRTSLWPTRTPPADPAWHRAQARSLEAACVRVLEMVRELHRLGYERIRMIPGWSPSGMHWRVCLTPASNLDTPTGGYVQFQGLDVFYSSAEGWHHFRWGDAYELTPRQMATRFLRKFQRIAQAGWGDDAPYAKWTNGLIGAMRKGGAPYFYHNVDLSRGVPMGHRRPQYQLPPALPKHGPVVVEAADPERGLAPGEIGRLLPGDFRLDSHDERADALVALLRESEERLAPLVERIWSSVSWRKSDWAASLARRTGVNGKGKVALRRCLHQFLSEGSRAYHAVGELPRPADIGDFQTWKAAASAHIAAMEQTIEHVAHRYAHDLDPEADPAA